jgi:hypothetical protein
MNRSAPPLWLALAVLLVITVSPAAGEGPDVGVAVELRLTDGSVLKVALREPRVSLKTPYGTLSIPMADVVRIEFAARVPDDVARRVAELASTDFQVRNAAHTALERMGSRAFVALTSAASHKDAEVARRAKDLLEKLREDSSDEPPQLRKHDVVYTADSKITGRIEGEMWRAESTALGELRLRLNELRELRAAGAVDAEPDSGAALADPGNLTSFQQQVGKRFAFKVTGAVGGSVWGTDTYTTDSNLAAAAVHAGVLRVGQSGLVHVKIVAPPASFTGSARNGVTSQDFPTYPGAYQVLRRRP